jgi:hypothetical protein
MNISHYVIFIFIVSFFGTSAQSALETTKPTVQVVTNPVDVTLNANYLTPIIVGTVLSATLYFCYKLYTNYTNQQRIIGLSDAEFTTECSAVCNQHQEKFKEELILLTSTISQEDKALCLAHIIRRNYTSFKSFMNTLTGSLNILTRWNKHYKLRFGSYLHPDLETLLIDSRAQLKELKKFVENLEEYKKNSD